MNLVNVIMLCHLTTAQYVDLELSKIQCDKPALEDCFEYKKPGEINYISGEKGLDMFIVDTIYEFERACDLQRL